MVRVNVAITDLERLRDEARAATRKDAMDWPGRTPSDHWVEIRSEGVAFCFENHIAAFRFMQYCARNHIQMLVRDDDAAEAGGG